MHPPININPDKFSDKFLLLLFKNILLVWERHYQKQKRGFDVRSREIRSFRDESGLVLQVSENSSKLINDASELRIGATAGNMFVFTSNTSQVFDLFRHLRNSVAHGNFSRIKLGRFNHIQFYDECQKKTTMQGQVKEVDLESFIQALYKSRA